MSAAALKGRGVLITRALSQAQALQQAVESQGGRAYLFPVLEIQFTPDPVLEAELEQLQAGDVLIFVSMNAVAGVFQKNSADLRGKLSQCRIAAVGGRTRQALQDQGINVDIQAAAEQQNSEGLLQHTLLQSVAGRQVWIIRGQSGRELLRDELQQRGASVSYIQAYRRCIPAVYDAQPVIAALQARQIQWVMLTSYGMFENLLQMLGQQAVTLLQPTRLVVPGRRVAEKIRAEYDLEVDVADNASDQAMLKKLG